MSILNERNDKTKKNIHLMVTSLCSRNCPHCCNKQYSLNDVPYITDLELRECEMLFITGGEPFEFSNPSMIAKHYKELYKNIKKVIVYTNAFELSVALKNNPKALDYIDGVNISIKNNKDYLSYLKIKKKVENVCINNRIYDFTGKIKGCERKWQSDFVPADDSIFRKV